MVPCFYYSFFVKSRTKWRVLLSSVAVLCILFGCAKRIPRSERMGLAVLNFMNITQGERAKEFQPWEYGIPMMLITDIESIGLFNIVSRERLKDILEEQKLQYSGLVDKEQAVQLGKIAAAHYILTGSFAELNEKLRIEARVFSVEKGIQLGAASVTGETDRFFEIEKELVIKVSGYLRAMLTEEEKERIAANIETRSVNASLNNYAGEIAVMESDALREQGKTDEADDLLQKAKKKFKKAIEHDPGYKKPKENLARLAMGIPLTL